MDEKLLSPLREPRNPTTNSHPDSRLPRRMLRRNCSDSEILDKDVPPVHVEGRANVGCGCVFIRVFLLFTGAVSHVDDCTTTTTPAKVF